MACKGRADAALLCLADQPLVTSDTMSLIIRAYCQASPRHLAVAPVHAGRRGNPVLVDKRLFDEIIRDVSGDRGTRDVLERHSQHLILVPAGPEVLLDVDTEADIKSLRNRYNHSGQL